MQATCDGLWRRRVQIILVIKEVTASSGIRRGGSRAGDGPDAVAAADPILIDTKKNDMLGHRGFSLRSKAIDMAGRATRGVAAAFLIQTDKGTLMRTLLLLASPALMLAGCSDHDEKVEEKLERSAETSATVAGALPAALGLSEAQLIDAELVGKDGKELGDVAQVVRDADGKVDRLLVEVDGVGPDRYVHVPITGLAKIARGDDIDLQSPLTAAELAALPDVKPPAK